MPKAPAAEAPSERNAPPAVPSLAAAAPVAETRRVALVASLACGAAAFLLYWLTLAPGLTWSHFGADGGELLAAATTNGVPHPPGYPLYMLLLQGWLWLAGWLFPASDIAWRGNLLSALLAAASVGLSVPLMARLLARLAARDPRAEAGERGGARWLWACAGSLAWGASQQLWSQALITEVYALHALIIVLLLRLLFAPEPAAPNGDSQRTVSQQTVSLQTMSQQTASLQHVWWLALPIGLGLAHHVTIVLLLPAVLYYVRAQHGWRALPVLLGAAVVGALGALLLHTRTPLVAGGWSLMPSPINWGYPDNPDGLWWLLSGSAYRSYLFDFSRAQILEQVSEWAFALTRQFSPLGLAIALLGFAHLDAVSPRLRNFGLLWVLPISFYSIIYYTRDSEIYLLPVVWLLAFWLAVGLTNLSRWLNSWLRATRAGRPAAAKWITAGLAAAALVVMVGWRWPAVSLHNDAEARDFVQQAAQSMQPGSVLVASGDFQTFAFWYGAFASGDLLPGFAATRAENGNPRVTPPSKSAILAADIIVVNDSLYQFDWYRRLLADLYPDVPGVDASLQTLLLTAQQSDPPRPVFFSDQGISSIPDSALEADGVLWRYAP